MSSFNVLQGWTAGGNSEICDELIVALLRLLFCLVLSHWEYSLTQVHSSFNWCHVHVSQAHSMRQKCTMVNTN